MKNTESMRHPTLILENGVVFSGQTPPVAGTSVAISGNRIMAVGPPQEIARLASNSTERIDLRGRSLVPGFIDSHTCFATDCRKVGQISLGGKPFSADMLAELLRPTAMHSEPGEWVVAVGYAPASAGAGALSLRREDLDRMVTDRPAALISSSMDLLILNSTGMGALGLAARSEDLADVDIERDSKLQPTGRFRGKIDQTLPDGFPCHDSSLLKRKMRKLGMEYIRRGITTINDIDLYRAMDIASYASLRQENALPLRVIVIIRGFPRDDVLRQHYLHTGLGTGFGDAWLRLGAMKFSVDGLMGRQTAAVSSPWGGEPGSYGKIFFSEEELVEKIRQVTDAGFQVAFHANGDRAIGKVLHAIKKAQRLVSRPILRPRIHHCTLPDPEHIQQMGETGAIPIGHPHFIRFMGDAHLRSLGEARIRAGYFPFRSFLDQGIPAVLSAEPVLPLEQIHPMIGISAAMTRRSLAGEILAADQRVSLEEAIRMYTLHPAYAAFEEDEKGSIVPGKLADLVVLETDLRDVDADSLADVQVDYTLLDGKIAFSRA